MGRKLVDAEMIHRRRWGILGVLLVSLLVVVLDNTVLNVALRTIQEDLDTSQSQLAWAVNSYTLVFAGLLFTFGLVGDRFGRKRILIAGLVLFALASIASAYAQSPEQLILFRSIMGIGGAAVMPATLAIITNVFEPEERGRAIGIWVASVGLAIVIGPVVGGSLLEFFWWGSVFLINVPVIAIGVALVAWVVPNSRDPEPGRLDPIGVGLSIGALVLLVYGIIEGGEQASFAPPEVWGTVLGGVALFVVFAWHERRSDHPALDLSLFRNPALSASVSVVGLMFLALMGVVFILSFYWQFARGYTPLQTGLLFLPFASSQLVFAPMSSSVVARFGLRATAGCGLAVVALTLFSLAFIDETTSLVVLGAIFFLQGAAMANVMPPLTTAVMGAVPRHKAGIGSALNNTMRQVGGAFGVAVLGAVLAVQYRDRVTPALDLLPEAVRDEAAESLGATLIAAEQTAPSAVPAVREIAVPAFVDGLHIAAFLAAGVVAVSTLVVVRYLPTKPQAEAAGDAATDAEPVGSDA